MTECVIYSRVSSERQVQEGNGVSSQEHRCRAYALANNYEILEVFRDEGVSGALRDRPDIQRLLAYLRQHKSTEPIVVVVDDISRIARDMFTHLELTAAIKACGGILESPSFNFQDTASGKMVEMMMAAMAEYGRTGNREQVLNRQRARLELGYWTFPAPQGYIFQKHPLHTKLLVPKDNVNVLAKGLEQYSRGTLSTKRELALYLQQGGFYPLSEGITVLEKRVTRLFECLPLYAGYIEYPKWEVPRVEGKHKAIISREVFYQIQERETLGRVFIQRTNTDDERLALRNFVRCSACAAPLTASFAKGRYLRYHCYKQDCELYGHSIKQRELYACFERLLLSLEAKPDLMELVYKLGKQAWKAHIADWSSNEHHQEKIVKNLEEDLALVASRLGRTTDDAIATVLEANIKDLKGKYDLAVILMNKYKEKPPDFEEAFGRVGTIIKSPYSYWKSGSVQQKKTVHRFVFTVPPSYNRETGFGTVDLTLPYQITTKYKDNPSRLVEVARVALASNAGIPGILHAHPLHLLDTLEEAGHVFEMYRKLIHGDDTYRVASILMTSYYTRKEKV